MGIEIRCKITKTCTLLKFIHIVDLASRYVHIAMFIDLIRPAKDEVGLSLAVMPVI